MAFLKHSICGVLTCMAFFIFGQGTWEVDRVAVMPEAVANNAVVEADIDGNKYAYSFSGIDDSKLFSGIHKRCFKYDVQNNTWTNLPDLPTGNGRIAAGASLLKDKIYIIGGYEVFSNGSEVSYSTVHVFDPLADTFLNNAANTIIPIDDHVQGVWRDSLIYVITGWSNNTNVQNVQIFNPTTDTWMPGSSVPNDNNYKVFGGSGTIIGDTIYYAGGASLSGAFNATNFMRKGVINPSNPRLITWSGMQEPDARGYRMAASSLSDKPIWFGGSQVTYNYNGIAYNGSGGVAPNGDIRTYNDETNEFAFWDEAFPATMDFRGVAKISENQFILAGGMQANQIVSDSVYLLTFNENSSMTAVEKEFDIIIQPNPFISQFRINSSHIIDRLDIYSIEGKLIHTINNPNNIVKWNLGSGHFVLSFSSKSKGSVFKQVINVE